MINTFPHFIFNRALFKVSVLLVLSVAMCALTGCIIKDKPVGSAPPMGWNSYAAYPPGATESDIKKSIDYISQNLLSYGYDTVTVDAGWFFSGPAVSGGAVLTDDFGRPESSPYYFPSGLPSVIAYAHRKHLKFGLWLIRGVDRGAAAKNLPILGTSRHLQDIQDTNNFCHWDNMNWGVDMAQPGAQEYYDSMIAKYAAWGVDFIKYDDMVPHPDEIRAVAKAIKKIKPDMILSLSPGDEIRMDDIPAYKLANLVRITHDIWDNKKSLESTFERWEQMQEYDGPAVGSWLDMDMICFGKLSVNRDPHLCAFTPDQKRTFIVQRAMAASPLILGGVIFDMDKDSLDLFRNREIIACDQNGVIGHLATRQKTVDVWQTPAKFKPDQGWLGIFNRAEKTPARFALESGALGLDKKCSYQLTDVLEQEPIRLGIGQVVEIPPDGVLFLRYARVNPDGLGDQVKAQ
jgi:alpha-galactosidase